MRMMMPIITIMILITCDLGCDKDISHDFIEQEGMVMNVNEAVFLSALYPYVVLLPLYE